jgi:hypothetical protein
VIGKNVLTMLVAAAKINQSSIVPAFDQTGVPRIIQVPSGAAKMGFSKRAHIMHKGHLRNPISLVRPLLIAKRSKRAISSS